MEKNFRSFTYVFYKKIESVSGTKMGTLLTKVLTFPDDGSFKVTRFVTPGFRNPPALFDSHMLLQDVSVVYGHYQK